MEVESVTSINKIFEPREKFRELSNKWDGLDERAKGMQKNLDDLKREMRNTNSIVGRNEEDPRKTNKKIKKHEDEQNIKRKKVEGLEKRLKLNESSLKRDKLIHIKGDRNRLSQDNPEEKRWEE